MTRTPGQTAEQMRQAPSRRPPFAAPLDHPDATRDAATSAVSTISLPVNATTAHTEGAWTEVVAALSEEAWGVRLASSGYNSTAVAREALIDIGIGAAASEVAIVTDVDMGYWPTYGAGTSTTSIIVPVVIPAGSRVAARLRQSSTTGANFPLIVDFLSATPTGPLGRPRGNPVSIGATTATSSGTLLTAPGSNNAEAAWTELTSATTQPFSALLLNVGGAGNGFTAASCLVDLGVGASGAEQVILPNYAIRTSSTEALGRVGDLVPVPGPFPAGTRVVVRYQRSAGYALYAHVHGIP